MRSSEKLRFCYCEPFYIPVIASSSLSVIASPFFLVIARSEATKQSPLLLYPVIANRRVGKCAGVKQSPHCTFLLVLGVLGGLLRLIVIRLAMTLWGYRLAMTPLPVIASPSLPVIVRSEATKQSPIAPPRHCEPKGWQVCWREAISSLHVLVGVRCSGGIASLTTFARNDVLGLQARNDVKVACNGNFSQVNKEKELKKNKIINQQNLNPYGN